MYDIIYIKSLFQNNKDIFSKIKQYENNSILFIKKYNNISQIINSNIDSIYNIENNKFTHLKTNLNYLISLLGQYNYFSNILLKIKESNNYYENKILINKKLLEKYNIIVTCIDQLISLSNYRDIINLINLNFLDELNIDNNSVNDKILDSVFANELDNNKCFDDDNKISEDKNNIDNEKILDEIEEYIEKKNNHNKNYHSEKNEINHQVDKENSNIKEFMITLKNMIIIKNRASINKLLLENDIQKNIDIISNNNIVYNYIYNFSTINFEYFNINSYNYFNSEIPKLPIFDNNNLFFDNYNNISKELLSSLHSVLSNSSSFSFELSNLKSYFTYLNDFFDITKLKSLLSNFEEYTLSSELVNIFENINNKFNFIKMQTDTIEIISHIESFNNIHENSINDLENNFLEFKNNVNAILISKKILIEEYNSSIYDIILYIIRVNNIKEIDIYFLKNILTSKKILSLFILDKIISYLISINKTYNELSYLILEEISQEKLLIENHERFIVCNNNLQQLLANNFYENYNEITQINKDLLTIEEKIKVIVETIDNIKNNIDASEHLISSNKNNILDEIYNIIKYYN